MAYAKPVGLRTTKRNKNGTPLLLKNRQHINGLYAEGKKRGDTDEHSTKKEAHEHRYGVAYVGVWHRISHPVLQYENQASTLLLFFFFVSSFLWGKQTRTAAVAVAVAVDVLVGGVARAKNMERVTGKKRGKREEGVTNCRCTTVSRRGTPLQRLAHAVGLFCHIGAPQTKKKERQEVARLPSRLVIAPRPSLCRAGAALLVSVCVYAYVRMCLCVCVAEGGGCSSTR